MRKTARSAVVVMTVVVVADLVAAMIVVDHRRAVMDRAVGRRRGVMALALARVLQVPVVGSDPVVKEVLRVVMATTVVVRRVVLGIVTGMARPSVSGWKFRGMCRSRSFRKTRPWMPLRRMFARRVMLSACLMPRVLCLQVVTDSWCAFAVRKNAPRGFIMCLRTAVFSSPAMKR